jgi:histidine ammonia-lyase
MSARKALEVVANVERVLAIELLAAVQALEFSAPLKATGMVSMCWLDLRSW